MSYRLWQTEAFSAHEVQILVALASWWHVSPSARPTSTNIPQVTFRKSAAGMTTQKEPEFWPNC